MTTPAPKLGWFRMWRMRRALWRAAACPKCDIATGEACDSHCIEILKLLSPRKVSSP